MGGRFEEVHIRLAGDIGPAVGTAAVGDSHLADAGGTRPVVAEGSHPETGLDSHLAEGLDNHLAEDRDNRPAGDEVVEVLRSPDPGVGSLAVDRSLDCRKT